MKISLAILVHAISASLVVFDENAREAELESVSFIVTGNTGVTDLFGDSLLLMKIKALQLDAAIATLSKNELHVKVKELREERLQVEDALFSKIGTMGGSDRRFRFLFAQMSELSRLEDLLDEIDRSLGY